MGRSRERMLALVAFGRVVPCWRWGGVSAVPVGMGHSIFLEEWERGTGAGCMKVATEWGGGGGNLWVILPKYCLQRAGGCSPIQLG